MAKYLTLEHLGQSAIITINNPPANAWNITSLRELADLMTTLQADSTVRAVVITGAGDAFFCAGADLNLFSKGSKQEVADLLDAFAGAFAALRNYTGVTVAAINGYALGGGLECALMCDYIVAERGAKLGLPEARVGLLPAAGGSKTLADKVGLSWAKRMLLGGEILTAEKAYDIGLVEEIVDPGFAKIMAVSLAGKVANQAPQAVARARQLIESSPCATLEAHLQQERAALLSLIGEAEQLEGVSAFLGKRTPSWADED
ncbi:enoyl-CoA hydratase [Aquitalea magnusonii]|jgi:enoyl-CoA hydratase/carnithine racemase|uniref:Enoyl-CoA hydratase n=1 Tax=Aquitalea magnusonii TaxID=332411 RepID=A0A3G9GEY5_9NEIS|nr:enoyl-CoA hydratase [Aquitalea magnusonii]BBF84811.1 enoyl-CoA hydratase [Aquitalea magnusonii]